MMKPVHGMSLSLSLRFWGVILFLFLSFRNEGARGGATPPAPLSLEGGFHHPPMGARMRCYWWWLNSNVDEAGITRDLEWMHSIGMGGAMIFDAGDPARSGPVPNGPTFGTPAWVKLFQHALQESDRLGLKLSITPQSGWNLGGPSVTPEEAAKRIAWASLNVTGPQNLEAELPQPPQPRRSYLKAPFYKDTYVIAFPVPDGPPSSPIRALAQKSLAGEIGGSAPDCSSLLFDIPAKPGEASVASHDVVNLTSRLSGDGTLHWDVPAGKWEILRFGYVNNGARVSTSNSNWQGLVVDYLDADALKDYWRAVVDPLFDQAGPLVGKSLEGIETDSWEAGGLSWTAKLPEEFKRRRGYDLLPYLPVFAGHLVDGRDVSNRFLADFRKTIGDCMADDHYGVLEQLAASRGLFTHCEASGPHAGPFDGLKNLGRCDRAMGEFWVASAHRPTEKDRFFEKVAASAGHTYGKPIICGEAFTSIGPQWEDLLWSAQKPTFDHEACAGVNLIYWHAFTSSPGAMEAPGQQYFAGTHLDPRVTWAKQAPAFVSYINRCQYLLQQGQFVADACYYYGDHVPNVEPRKEADPANVLPVYDYDAVDEEVLLHKASVKDGRVVLATGMTYRVLVLPSFRILSLPVLRKVAALVHDGATIVGPKPLQTESLEGYPACDTEFKKLADRLWGNGSVSDRPAKEVLTRLGVPPDLDDGGAGLHYIHRRDGDTDIYFVSNQGAAPLKPSVTFRVAGRVPELWDPVSGAIRSLPQFEATRDSRTQVLLEFGPYQSYLVIFRNAAPGSRPSSTARKFPPVSPFATLDGPWAVSFDPKWGGPAAPVRFDTLVDWTARPEPGMRYYSGTATYRKRFEAPGVAGKRQYLDLGALNNLAEVRLNGKALGVVWTPPFRVEVTGLLKPGGNELEVDIVNTWYNRVLLDSTLPEAQRLTHTNVTFFPKNSRPVASGLLGPVTLQSSD